MSKVADIIDLTKRLKGADNLIVSRPLEFRRAEWRNSYTLMCTRGESIRYEAQRAEALALKGPHQASSVPNHFTLDGGYHYTLVGLFRYRENEEAMRRVYRLAGMMECVTNAPSPVLRTDLLRRFYQSILDEREALNMVWRGTVRHFLLPIFHEHRNPNLFLHHIGTAESLKDLYLAVQAETDAQFDILSEHYVFYLPESLWP